MTLALLACLCLQDGGSLTWVGKGADPVEPVLEDVQKLQKPLLLFFSSEGDAACKKLCNTAFRDPDVLAAASKITCVWVECGGKRNLGFMKTIGVTATPTLVVCDWHGTVLGGIPQRDGPAIALTLKKLTEVTEGLPQFTEDVDTALATARAKRRLLLIYFYDDSPPSLALNKSLTDPLLRPLNAQYSVARSPMKKGSPLCVKFDVDHAPTILILNAQLPKPEEKPLARITASRSAHELQRDLEEALDAARAAGIVASDGPGRNDPTSAPAKTEKLSDDEVDRKFIRIRFAKGMELAKAGKKAEALDVLQDIVVTFPKHVETVAVKKYIEELKAGK